MKGSARIETRTTGVVVEMTLEEAVAIEEYLDGDESADWNETTLGQALRALSYALYEGRRLS